MVTHKCQGRSRSSQPHFRDEETVAQAGEVPHRTRGPGRCGPAAPGRSSVDPHLLLWEETWRRVAGSQLHWASVTPAWLSADPEPTAVPRHGPLLVQRGRVLLFKHSRPCQALQVRSPCTAPAGVAGCSSGPRFPGGRTWGAVQGGYEHMMHPSPASRLSSPGCPPHQRTGPAC